MELPGWSDQKLILEPYHRNTINCQVPVLLTYENASVLVWLIKNSKCDLNTKLWKHASHISAHFLPRQAMLCRLKPVRWNIEYSIIFICGQSSLVKSEPQIFTSENKSYLDFLLCWRYYNKIARDFCSLLLPSLATSLPPGEEEPVRDSSFFIKQKSYSSQESPPSVILVAMAITAHLYTLTYILEESSKSRSFLWGMASQAKSQGDPIACPKAPSEPASNSPEMVARSNQDSRP